MEEQAKKPTIWAWPQATPFQRAYAFVLDLVILAATLALVNLITASLDLPLPLWSNFFLAGVYWFLMHAHSGQTIGKRLIGSKVVAQESEAGAERRAPLLRLLVRDLPGRALSALPFGYGYLRILVSKDQRSLHDVISRTRVVSLVSSSTSPIGIKHAVASVLSLAIIAFIAILVLFQFTPYPLMKLADSLRADGFKIGRVEGSVSNGFWIERLAYVDDRLSVEIEGLRVQPGERSRNEEGEPVIAMRTVSADNMKVKFLKWTPFKAKGEDLDAVFKPVLRPWFSRTSRGLSVGVFDAGNVSVSVPGREPFTLKRLYFNDLDVRTTNSTITVGRVWGNGDTLLVDAKSIFAQEGQIQLGQPAHVQIKPEFSPEVIGAPIDLQVEGTIDGLHPSDIKLSAFGGKLRFDWHEAGGELRLSDLTPLHHMKTELPFRNIDLSLFADSGGPRVDRMRGRLSLRGVGFDIEPPYLVHQKGLRKFMISPRLSADWKAMLAGREPGFILGSSDRLTARDALAEIYFSKSITQLTERETETVDEDMRYFTDTPDAGIPTLTQARVLKSVHREPASRKSVKKKRSAKSKIPTQLPPKKARARKS